MYKFDIFPQELKNLRQWICWKTVIQKGSGKKTKEPRIPGTDDRGSSTDPEKWRSFNEAASAYQQSPGRYDGIGFVFKAGGGYVGIDIDHCVIDGELSELAKDVLAMLDSYAEYSPSGTGVHIICKAQALKLVDGTAAGRDDARGLEFYFGSQYFTVTGNAVFPAKPVNERQEAVRQFVNQYFPEKLQASSQTEPQNGPALPPPASVSMSDDEVLARIRNSAQAAKFSRLHDAGDYSAYLKEDGTPDHSRGDGGEIEILCYYTQDPNQVYRIFSTSALARSEKGLDKRRKYLMDTIKKAIARVLARGTVYDPAEYFRKKALAELSAEADLDLLKRIFYYPLSDAGRADRVRAVLGGDWIYSSGSKDWFCWEGTRWKESSGSALSELMIRLARSLKALVDAGEISFDETQQKQKEKYLKFYAAWEETSKITNTKKLLADFLNVEDPGFDKNVALLNMPDCTLNLETGEQNAHRREDFITKITGCSASATYEGSLWEKTLNEVLPDAGTRQYFQRFCGYCLSGDVSEEKFIIAYGEGGAGKGTLLEAIAAAMGDYATQIPVDLLLQSKANTGEGPAAQLLDLRGKRLALCSESGLGRRLNEAKIKWITGGDTLTARGMYAKKPSHWLPSHKVIIQSNYMPQIADAMDTGIRRRLVIIPFRASGFTVNPKLKAQLKAPEELPAVMAWLLEGYWLWQREGLGPESAEMLAAKGKYYDEQDLLQHWLDECCVIGPGHKLHLTTGKEAFNTWLTNGRTTQESVGLKRFRADMEAHGFRIERKNRGNYFIGVDLIAFTDPEICKPDDPDIEELLG